MILICVSILSFKFMEMMFIDVKSGQKAVFSKSGSPIKFSANYNKGAADNGVWTSESQGVASSKYKYQLLICNTPYYKGLHLTGNTNCYKACNNWCGDTSTPYFRTAAETDQSRNGVAFNENGHKPLKNRLLSAGIR